jgi:hypothetical protein
VPCHVNRPAYTSSYKGPIKIGVWPIEARRNRIHAIRLCHVTRRRRDETICLPASLSHPQLPSSTRFPRGICWTSLRSLAPVLSHPGPNACPLTALCFDSGESRRDPPLGFLCVSVPVLLLRLKFCGCSWLASAPPVLSIVTANLCPCCVSALHCCGPVHWEFGMPTEVSSRLSLKGDGHGPVWN